MLQQVGGDSDRSWWRVFCYNCLGALAGCIYLNYKVCGLRVYADVDSLDLYDCHCCLAVVVGTVGGVVMRA